MPSPREQWRLHESCPHEPRLSPRRDNFFHLIQGLCDEYDLLHNAHHPPSPPVSCQSNVQVQVDGHGNCDDSAISPMPSLSANGLASSTHENTSSLAISKLEKFNPKIATDKLRSEASFVGDSGMVEIREDDTSDPGRTSATTKMVRISLDEAAKKTRPRTSQLQDEEEAEKRHLELLREEFDRLDSENEDRIPLDRCFEVVEKFAETPDQQEIMRDTLKTLVSNTSDGLDVDAQSSRTASEAATASEYLTFEHFQYIMDYGKNSTTTLDATKINNDLSTLWMLQRTFTAFDKFQKSLAEQAEQRRQKHRQIMLWLDLVPAPVIIANSLVMGLQAETPDADIWKVFEVAFLLFYVAEAVTKGCVFTWRVYFCGPELWWNWFDLLCVIISAFDVFWEIVVPLVAPDYDSSSLGELMLMKMLRLAKLARLVKALHYPMFRELKAMIFGVVSGMRVLLWAIVLLLVVVFFLGVCLRNLLDGEEEFETVPASMFTVFRCLTDGCDAYNGTPLTERLRKEHGAVFIVGYVAVFMFVTFGIFNLIVAIFIENVVMTSEQRRQHDLAASESEIRQKLETIFAKLIIFEGQGGGPKHHLLRHRHRKELRSKFAEDPKGAYLILTGLEIAVSRKVFKAWMSNEGLVDLLVEADIETANTMELFDVLDADMSGQLSIDEVVDGLMRLRGPMTKADMIAVRMKMQYVTQVVQGLAEVCDLEEPDKDHLLLRQTHYQTRPKK